MKFHRALVVALLLGPIAAASPAAASTSGQHDNSPKSCVIVLDRLQPGETESRVVYEACSTDAEALDDSMPDHPTRRLLMTWYTDADFSGAHVDIYGWLGTCDSQGYGISNVGDAWNDRISSFAVWGQCHFTRVWEAINYEGVSKTFAGNVNWVGADWNDRISSMKVTA